MERQYSERYRFSEQMLERALKYIPLGSQTFSKSKAQFPYGVSPYFIKRGQGSHVWDVDDNEYIDYISALAAITLGHNDPDVTAAVKSQLNDGTIFSLPHELELLVAEKIIEMVPCAEMVRFGKNGSDVTAGAVRLARAYTKREHIAACGYHGWQDWFIASTSRNLGVPKALSNLVHSFTYNNIDSLKKLFEKHPNKIAGVIMEPVNFVDPEDGYLEKVKELTHRCGAILIFDEIITGFRYSIGGAQEYFDVIPDLATFGKGMANGYPLSAVAGRGDIMELMEEVFFSFTFGGETLSLAASLATLKKLQKEPVIKTLWKQGRKLIEGTERLIEGYSLNDVISIGGKGCWSSVLFKDAGVYSQWEIKTLFMQEVFKRGILTFGSHNITYAHSNDDISRLIDVYDQVFSIIKDVITNEDLDKRLKAVPLTPLFKIR